MTADVSEPGTDVTVSHTVGKGRPEHRGNDSALLVTPNDVLSITWPPSKRHLVIVGCVAALLVTVAAVVVFDVSPGNLLIFAMVLVCPLMHIFMMRGMGHGGQQGCHGSQASDTQTSDQPERDKA